MDGIAFILWIHAHPTIALKGERSSTIENFTFKTMGLTFTRSTISPNDIIVALLNSIKMHPRLSKVKGE